MAPGVSGFTHGGRADDPRPEDDPMTATAGDRWVDDLLGRLDLAGKIGQMLVFGFCGPVVTPDVVDLVTRYRIGGLRVTTKFRGLTMLSDLPPGAVLPAYKQRSWRDPVGRHRDYAHHAPPIAATPTQYADTLNRIRTLALEVNGVPLHYAFDQEGNAVDDIVLGQRLFPHPLAYAVAGDDDLCERCARALARQCRALGLNMIHSPVLDVNVDPRNPEVGTRAYGDDPERVTALALRTLAGFAAEDLIATGKHFPGRGDSASDAHHGLPVVTCDRTTLYATHLAPFRRLIAAGLPAIMMAHCRYPALGADDLPASASPHIIGDLLRGELGFDGVIETDNMMMGGVLQLWEVVEACRRTVEAGTDLVLLRDEGPVRLEVRQGLIDAVRSGRIRESRIDESVRRILRLRWMMGLAADGGRVDAARAADPIDHPATVAAATGIAERSILVLRDHAGLLPLRPGSRVLLVEQIFPTHLHANNVASHPGLLWESLAAVSDQVVAVEIPYRPTLHDRERVRRRLAAENPDLDIATCWYYHKDGAGGQEVLDDLRATGRPLVVIANSPYDFAVPPALPTVVCTFHPGAAEQLAAVARVLYGRLAATARLPVARTG
jgi:beta-N-acetylhexosaminidase